MESVSVEVFIWLLTVTALIVLLFYNAVIYFYSQIKSFLFYAIYNFFLLVYVGSKTGLYSLYPGMEVSDQDNWYIQVIYNLAYLQFFRFFLDVKDHNLPLDNLLKRFLYVSFSVSTILFAGSLFADKLDLYHSFFLFLFLPAILILAVYSIIKVMAFRDHLKYYVIFGASFYILFGLTALYYSEQGSSLFGMAPISFFYIGILLENCLFSLGLGQKIKDISQERIQAKQMLILQLKENERIKENVNRELEKEIEEKTKELINALKEKEQEKIERLQLEYEQKFTELNLISLRNQMNPHFIFNALNAIKSAIIGERKKDAVIYLNKFSKLLREILRLPDEKNYTLEQELSTLKLYLNLENIRLKEKVHLSLEMEEGFSPGKYQIPALLLQPLVENAIWHGLSGVTDREKQIRLTFYTSSGNQYLHIDIEDNGIGLNRARKIKEHKVYLRDALGIKLVKDRLKLFAQQRNDSYSIELIDLESTFHSGTGTRVVMRIPVRKPSDL